MKTLTLSLAWVLAAVATTLGASLKMDQVAADAKWLVHLDVDYLLQTRLGNFLSQDIVSKHLGQQRNELREKLGVDLDWAKINSITAYGSALKPDLEPKGVLLINTDLNPSQLLDTLVMTFGGKEGDPNSAFRKIRSGNLPLYAIQNELFLSPLDTRNLLVGKSRDELTKAQAVISGKAPSLKSSDAFKDFPPMPDAFFMVATIGQMPFAKQDSPFKGSEAKKFGFLQMANSGRVAIGESKGLLRASISLKAADPDAGRQMQQVVQGMIALVSLSNSGDPLMRKLVQSARVSEDKEVITLGVELPTGDVIGKLRESDLKLEVETKDKKGIPHRKPSSRGADKDSEKAADPQQESEMNDEKS